MPTLKLVRGGTVWHQGRNYAGKGNPSKVILDIGKDIGADLLVIESSVMGGVKELLLGSVSHNVSNHATCPVLIVK